MRIQRFTRTALSALTLAIASPALADGHQAKYEGLARDILAETVSYRTARGHEQVPAMAEALIERLKAAGFADEDIHLIPQVVKGEQTASLLVRYRGDGSQTGKGAIGLLAHMDVVDALPKDWERDPFTLIEEDGFFFGRGVGDNKAGVVLLVTTFIRLKEEGFIPGRDMVLIFSGDEETDMETAVNLATNHKDEIAADLILNSDGGGGLLDSNHNPVFMSMQAAEKTYVDFELEVTNPGGHSSRPTKDNAIYELASALKAIEAYSFPVRTNSITLGYFAEAGKFTPGPLGDAMQAFAADPSDEDAIRALRDDPGTIGTTGTTCVATMLDAGHAPNALPQSAKANVNCRVFPGVPIADVRQQLIDAIDNPNVSVEAPQLFNSAPATEIPDDFKAVAEAWMDDNFPGVPLVPVMSSGATDSTHFRNEGIPSIGTGGIFIRSEDVYAHGLNERIPVDSFYKALDYWHFMLTHLAAPK